MKGQFQAEMDALARGRMFDTAEKVAECPYCGGEFKPAWRAPTEDETFGHWQRFCSKMCWKLWNEEKRDE